MDVKVGLINKAEGRRIDDFELWCWRRLLGVPWTARRSNQSILKEISPEYLLEDWCWSWNSNTLATWCEDLTHWKRPWCWEKLKAGGEGDDRGWDGWMASLTQWAWIWVSSGSWGWTEKPGVLQCMVLQTVRHNWVTELNWTERFNPLGSNIQKIPESKTWIYHGLATISLGFPGGSASKESACNMGDLDSIPQLGISPGEGNSYPLQYSGLENAMDCTVQGVTKSWTQLSDFHSRSLFT